MRKLIIAALSVFVCAVTALAQQSERQVNRDPDKARLVTSDIDNFWRAFDMASREADRQKRVAIFQAEYLDKGSPGLQDFLRMRIKSAEELTRIVDALPRFYASTRPSTLRVKEMEKGIRASFRKFKRLYPEAVFPDVYFVIGVANTGGTASKNGLLIGAELYGLTPSTPRDEFTELFRKMAPSAAKDEGQFRLLVKSFLDVALKPVEKVTAVVAHEAIHFNQSYPKLKTLLEQSIQEGAADFLGQMSAGELMTPGRNLYGDRHEAQLWREFQTEMMGTEMKNWLYNGVSSIERPGDLGYYMGYKICEAYYKNARDKRQAVRDILTIKDFPAFLEKSRYAEKFSR